MERLQLPPLTGQAVPTQDASLDLLGNVELDVRIDFGRAYLRREESTELDRGAIVPLDKTADEPVDIFAGGRLIARGEVLVLDGNYAVRVTELVAGTAAV